MQRNVRRNITVGTLQTTTPNVTIRIEVDYTDGGMSPFAEGTVARGYYLGAKPVRTENGMCFVTACAGASVLISDAKRFNASLLQQYAGLAATGLTELRDRVLRRVLQANKLTLLEAP